MLFAPHCSATRSLPEKAPTWREDSKEEQEESCKHQETVESGQLMWKMCEYVFLRSNYSKQNCNLILLMFFKHLSFSFRDFFFKKKKKNIVFISYSCQTNRDYIDLRRPTYPSTQDLFPSCRQSQKMMLQTSGILINYPALAALAFQKDNRYLRIDPKKNKKTQQMMGLDTHIATLNCSFFTSTPKTIR